MFERARRRLVARPQGKLQSKRHSTLMGCGAERVAVNAVMDTIRKLKEERFSMLLVEQNAEMALQLAERVYVIDHGSRAMAAAPPRAFAAIHPGL